MASGKSAYLRNALLNLGLGGAAWSPPASLYVALSTAAWSASTTGASLSGSEPSGLGYARVSTANNTTTWPTTTTGVKTNNVVIQFSTASGSWGTVQSFYLIDASSGGNILYGGDLYVARSVLSGDTPKFSVGQMTVTES